MKNTLKKIWNVVSTALVVMIILCAVFLMGSRLIGFRCYNILSPSMVPVYDVGDLIYVKEVDPTTIKEGDVITFIINEDLAIGTHRVIRVDAENQLFYTKGDANEREDAAPVHFNNVIGVPKFSIPKLGYVSDFVQNPPGLYITIAAFVVLIVIVFLPDIIGKKKKTKELQTDGLKTQTELDAATEENERLKAEVEELRTQMAEKQSDNEEKL